MSKNDFAFLPTNDDGEWEELSFKERMDIFHLRDGDYMIHLADISNPSVKADVWCAMENARVPTHKRKGADISKSFGVGAVLHGYQPNGRNPTNPPKTR
jgi:hypothetical protein